jgi:hypothetical protein
MAIVRQLGDAIGQGGHGRQVGTSEVGIRNTHADVAFAKKQQLYEGKRVNASLGQRAVFIEILSLGYEVGTRELTKFSGDFLRVCFWGHCHLVIS